MGSEMCIRDRTTTIAATAKVCIMRTTRTSFKYLDTYKPVGKIEREALQLRPHPVWHQLWDLLRGIDWTKTSKVDMPQIEQLHQIIKLVKTVRAQFNERRIQGTAVNLLAINALITREVGHDNVVIYSKSSHSADSHSVVLAIVRFLKKF